MSEGRLSPPSIGARLDPRRYIHVTPPDRRRRAAITAFARRWSYLTILGLVLGAIVHIVTVLMVPMLAGGDAVSRFIGLGSEGRAEIIAPFADPAHPIVDTDPATVVGACGFDLSDGPLRIVAKAGQVPLGLSVHRRGGGVTYAITDRAAIRGVVEFVLLTERQLAERIAGEDDGETRRELRVVARETQGIVVARALVRRPSDRQDAASLVSEVACGLAD